MQCVSRIKFRCFPSHESSVPSELKNSSGNKRSFRCNSQKTKISQTNFVWTIFHSTALEEKKITYEFIVRYEITKLESKIVWLYSSHMINDHVKKVISEKGKWETKRVVCKWNNVWVACFVLNGIHVCLNSGWQSVRFSYLSLSGSKHGRQTLPVDDRVDRWPDGQMDGIVDEWLTGALSVWKAI